MRRHGLRLSTLVAVAYASACAPPGPPAEAGAIERVERVPATPPNFQPPQLEVGLVANVHGDLVSTHVLTVTFEVGVRQAERQSAIDLVAGTVIGGVSTGHDGWYYVEVAGDGTIETIFEIAHTLDAPPQVDLAAPYTQFRVVPGGVAPEDGTSPAAPPPVLWPNTS